jgi:hypothetical protein
MSERKPTRDAQGRFVKAKPAQAVTRPAPIAVSSIWLPDARWVAPSAADRALARAVVAAADAKRIADETAVVTAKRLAEYTSRAAILDHEREPKDWVRGIGMALILAIVAVPMAVGCTYLVKHKTVAQQAQPILTMQMPSVDAISGGNL